MLICYFATRSLTYLVFLTTLQSFRDGTRAVLKLESTMNLLCTLEGRKGGRGRRER